MDVSFLDAAQQELVATIDAGAGRFRAPAGKDWPAPLVVAHLILTTELLVRTTEHTLTGARTWWDNAPASMRANLDEVVRAGGDVCGLLDRYWFAAEALTYVAAKLTPAQAAQPIPVRLMSGSVAVVDQVLMPWSRTLRWHAEQHVPEHVATLRLLAGRR